MIFNSWLFWALAAAVTWGAGQVVAKKGLSYFTPLAYNLLGVPLDVLILLPFALVLGIDLSRLGFWDIPLIVFVTSTYLLYFYAISLGSVALVGTILSLYPLVTMFSAIVFLGERVTGTQIFWSLIILLGAVLIGLKNEPRKSKIEKWFWFALVSAILIGLGDFVAKFVIDRIGPGNYFLLYGPGFIPGLLVAFLVDKSGRRWPRISAPLWLLSILGVSLIVLGIGFFFTAFSKGPASLVAPISSSYAVITVVLAMIFLKEKLTKTQALGVALAVLGIIFVGG